MITASCTGCGGAGIVEKMRPTWWDPGYYEAPCDDCRGSGAKPVKCTGCLDALAVVTVDGLPLCETCGADVLSEAATRARVGT